MARTNVADVKNVFETELSDRQLQLFVDDANALVTSKLGGEGVGTDLLARIERYVACHLASTHDPRTLSESVSDASAKFEGRVRSFDFVGLESTFYGQQAIALDPTGNLRQAGKRKAGASVALPDDFGEGRSRRWLD